MDDNLFDAKEELKRVDHLIFVSLKYTRTCDVIRSIIKRLISTYDFLFDGLLERLKREKKIKEIPKLPSPKCQAIKEHYPEDKAIQRAVDFYLLLRRFNLTKEFKRSQEYRRNVTMTIDLEDNCYEITIDLVTDYYKETREFLEILEEKYFEEGR